MCSYLKRFGRPSLVIDPERIARRDPDHLREILGAVTVACSTQFDLARQLRDWKAAEEAMENLGQMSRLFLGSAEFASPVGKS